MRLLFDISIILSAILAPWMLSVALLIIGLLIFESWLEGLVFVVLLDIMMFGGVTGSHTVYMILCFCALYYGSIRFKHMLRVA